MPIEIAHEVLQARFEAGRGRGLKDRQEAQARKERMQAERERVQIALLEIQQAFVGFGAPFTVKRTDGQLELRYAHIPQMTATVSATSPTEFMVSTHGEQLSTLPDGTELVAAYESRAIDADTVLATLVEWAGWVMGRDAQGETRFTP